MKLDVSVELNLEIDKISEAVIKASRLAMKDTVREIARDAIEQAPPLDHPHPTGTNKRSIKFEASGFETGEGVINQGGIEGAVYSTSGYGGFL